MISEKNAFKAKSHKISLLDYRKMQNNLETLHHQAMELVDRSIIAKQQGDDASSLELLR
jgi:ribosomal protein S20